MAETSQFQRPSPCDFCENPAQYQCQNCDDPLCTTCKEKHEKKRPHHKFVPYSQKASTVCEKHNAYKYLYWCEGCREPCCRKCVVKTHVGHSMRDIEEEILTKKESLRKTIVEPFQICLREWQILRQESTRMKNEYMIQIQKMDDSLIYHATNLHTSVSNDVEKTRHELQGISKSTIAVLQEQEKAIHEKYVEFETTVNMFEDFEHINRVDLLKSTVEIKKTEAVPNTARQMPPRCTPSHIGFCFLRSVFTIFTLGLYLACFNGICLMDHTDSLTNIFSTNATFIAKPLSQLTPPPSALLSIPLEVSSFNTYFNYPYIVSIKSAGLAWVRTGDKCLQLMDRQGVVHDTINTGYAFLYVAVTPQGNALFSHNNHRIISASKDMTSWSFTTSFTAEYRPVGLYVLRNGDIVVTYPLDGVNMVVQYSSKWTIIYEFDRTFFSFPVSVTVNKINNDLYVCDPTKRSLFAFKEDHSLRYEYTGLDAESFDPQDVTTDNNGRVLITDYENNKIHILDKDGKFIRYLQPLTMENPLSIDVDNEGNAWIGEFGGQVKIVKYY